MIKLTAADPRSDLLQIIRQQNPQFPVTTPDNLLVYNVAAGTTKNTKVSFYLKAAAGAAGKGAIEYDRIDIGKLLNIYGGTTKIPPVYMFGTPGTSMQLSTLTAELQAAFNINFNNSGYPDISDQTFTYPAKGAYVEVNLWPLSTSLRFNVANAGYRNTYAVARITNRGTLITSKAAQRNVNPFLRADGSLKWTLDLSSTPANCADRFTDVLLGLCDFSDIFAGHPAASGLFTMVGAKQYKFLPAVMDQINAKLASVGIKRQYSQSDAYHLSWVIVGGIQYSLAGFWGYTEGAYWTGTTSYKFYTGSAFGARTKPTRVVAGYTHVLKVMFPGIGTTALPTQDTAASDDMLPSQRWWLFQYNK